MAIFQYPFHAVPKKDIKNPLGELPSHLTLLKEIDSENYISSTQYWNDSSIEPSQIIGSIDNLLPRETWSNSNDSTSWKGDDNKEEDNDCWIGHKDNRITSFCFRVDMRNLKNLDSFLFPVLEICSQNEFALIGKDESVVNPNREEIMPLLLESKAVRFVQDPRGFLNQFMEDRKNK